MRGCVGVLVTVAALTLMPTASSNAVEPAARPTWDLTGDFRVSPNQENPSADSYGHQAVWTYGHEPAGSTDPSAARNLVQFTTNKFGVPGLEAWWGSHPSLPDDYLPAVGYNATGHDVVSPGTIHWPAGAVLVHPWWLEPVVIGWRSPVWGTLEVTGGVALAQQPNCGDGIGWALSTNGSTLAAGTINSLQTNRWSTTLHVKRGQRLYLFIDPLGSIYCDSTLVELRLVKY
jgi:hypothetical protein